MKWTPTGKCSRTMHSDSNRYYDEEGHLKYVFDAKELTELAKEVASVAYSRGEDEARSPRDAFNAAQNILVDRGIAWCDDE